MVLPLPERASIDWLRKTAKQTLKTLRRTKPGARLAEAQLVLARQHGFASWRVLKKRVDELSRAAAAASPGLPDDEVRAFLRRVGTGDLEGVRYALEHAPGLVHAVGPHPFWGGRPQALHVAVESRRHDVFALLLEKGADVSGRNDEYDGWSPLMLAVHRKAHAMRDELLRKGARVDLPEALMLGDDARVEALLRDGAASLPARAPGGGSFLAFARTPYAVDRLLAVGVEIDRPDRWGAPPIQAMSRLGALGDALVRHLVARGAAASPEIDARLGDRPALEDWASRQPDVIRRDDVMMAAVEAGRHDLVRWLLAQGAPVGARAGAPSRHTALHAAAWNGDLAMVTLLVEAGASPATRDDEHDSTALGWAETALDITNNPSCAAVVEYLRRGSRLSAVPSG